MIFLPWNVCALTLRQAYEYYPIADLPFPAEIVGNIILTFFVVELVQGDALSCRHRLHCLAELLRHLPQHNR